MHVRKFLNKTPYELYKNRKPNISHLHVFDCVCFALKSDTDLVGKFDSKVDECIFVGYSLNNKSYRLFNKATHCVFESIHVSFDDSKLQDEMTYIEFQKLTDINLQEQDTTQK